MHETSATVALAPAKEPPLVTFGSMAFALFLWAALILALFLAADLSHVFMFLADGFGIELSMPARISLGFLQFYRSFFFLLLLPLLAPFLLSAFNFPGVRYLRAVLAAVAPLPLLTVVLSLASDALSFFVRYCDSRSLPLSAPTLFVARLLRVWQEHYFFCELILLLLLFGIALLWTTDSKRNTFKIVSLGGIGLAALVWVLLSFGLFPVSDVALFFRYMTDANGVRLSRPTHNVLWSVEFLRGWYFFLSPVLFILLVFCSFRFSIARYARAVLAAVIPWSFLVLVLSCASDGLRAVVAYSNAHAEPLPQSALNLASRLGFWQDHYLVCATALLMVFLAITIVPTARTASKTI